MLFDHLFIAARASWEEKISGCLPLFLKVSNQRTTHLRRCDYGVDLIEWVEVDFVASWLILSSNSHFLDVMISHRSLSSISCANRIMEICDKEHLFIAIQMSSRLFDPLFSLSLWSWRDDVCLCSFSSFSFARSAVVTSEHEQYSFFFSVDASSCPLWAMWPFFVSARSPQLNISLHWQRHFNWEVNDSFFRFLLLNTNLTRQWRIALLMTILLMSHWRIEQHRPVRRSQHRR